MIRELKAARWVAREKDQDKYVIEVAIDDITELDKLKDNTAHGSVAQLIDANRLTVYIFNENIKEWLVI